MEDGEPRDLLHLEGIGARDVVGSWSGKTACGSLHAGSSVERGIQCLKAGKEEAFTMERRTRTKLMSWQQEGHPAGTEKKGRGALR